MYLSKLVLNPRHPLARRDLANPYEMHSTLARIFEKTEGVDGGEANAGDPHAGEATRLLWRLEPVQPPVVLLQSGVSPDFSKLHMREGYEGYFLAALESKPYELPARLGVGDILRFRLEANPTVTRAGKRHGLVRVDDQRKWLWRQGEKAGFTVLEVVTNRMERRRFRKRGTGSPIVLFAARFDGWLKVEEPGRLRKAISRGVGHGKALGLGLLSISRI